MKSYVTILKKKCIVCTKDFDDGLALDRTLRDRFEMYTESGWGVCPECSELSKDKIPLIVIDPSKSEILPNGNITPSGAWRTSSIQFVDREFAKHFIPASDGKPFLFIDEEVEQKIKDIVEEHNKKITK